MPSVRSRNDGVKTAGATGLEHVLKGKNTAIIGNTLHFESESVIRRCYDYRLTGDPALGVHDLDGTMISPGNIVEAVGSTDVFYHVWAAVKQTIDERCAKLPDTNQNLTHYSSTRGIPDNALTKYALERFVRFHSSIIFDI
jgi:hypothetical protein